jgi:hypothetical protein
MSPLFILSISHAAKAVKEKRQFEKEQLSQTAGHGEGFL